MTADIKLLPLPELASERVFGAKWDDFDMQDYARANVAHATAAKDAEIEALRAEVAAWRELSDHVRAGACNAIWPDRYTDARTRDVAASLKRAEPLKAEIEALRAEAIEWRGLFGMAKARADKAETRAERLAEALRHLRSHTSVNSYQIELIDDALHDHDQEVGNE